MTDRWTAPAHVKIHEGCGGRIRWVEAIDTPGVGFTGECLACGEDHIVVEDMIPIVVRGEGPGFGGPFDIRETVLDAPIDLLETLTWDDDATFQENQERLRSEIEAALEKR